jgi:hypothetical protein
VTGPGPGSTVITALERTWAEIRDRHTDVPEVVFVSGKGTKGVEVKWGHWCPERWQEFGARNNQLPEVFVSGECLAQGAERVLKTLLHEAAHGLAWVRGIKDTSRGNRYHNGKFVTLAEELGLVRPEVANEVRGWSACTLPDEHAATYQSLDQLREAIVVCIGGKLETGPEVEQPKEKKTQPKYGCGCEDRIVRMSKKVFEEAPVICGACMEPFLEVF